MRKTSKKYRRTAHAVGLAHVHMVWIPKRRKPVLVGEIKVRLGQILNEVASEKGWLLKAIEIAPDHVHVLVEHSSDVAIHEIAKALKGRSSRLLRQEFPQLLKLPSLWPRSYFYDTTGAISTAKIMAYINDPHHGS
ncbi:IS200/IS605 family transposase [Moorena sp. SIO3H5]|uniref:IS200/IS605 family transposase n=1 Tax=Moorena sp. SIO3H5 TaxID=2607834 RepID=UPI0013B686D3|nr:IS200/IS605 family transposase [Moorena sp. SIO3H5]NEO74507.1 IS200/IS605 family transposase [Moorena sp. SIO3H5]